MKSRRATPHAMSGVFVFLLLGLFAVFATIMVLMGAKAYRSTAAQSGVHNAARITSSYLRSMLRADDEAGALRVETVNGVETIALTNVYDDEIYVTRLYVYDGMLREWFTSAEEAFEPENGEIVCAADALTAEIDEELLIIHVQTDGEWNDVYCALRAIAS